MNRILFIQLIVIFVVTNVFGQSTTCSNSNLLMTPTSRQQILDVLNLARSKLETGQLLLSNGKYALQADQLTPLTWDCEMEERMVEWLEDSCEGVNMIPESSNGTWFYNRINDDNVDTLVSDMLANQAYLSGSYYTQLSRHNLYIGPISYLMNHIITLSDKADHVACAVQHCTKPSYTLNHIYCQISMSEKLEFGDEIYQLSSSVNGYIPPTQDVLCQNGALTIEQREAVLQKANEARSQISQGSYELENGNIAVKPATPLTPLLWSCEDENAMRMEKIYTSCPSGAFFDATTEFQKIVTGSWLNNNNMAENMLNWWSELGTEFFDHNPNFNFLYSNAPPSYSTTYPAAFTFSDKAETIACFNYDCFGSYPNFTIHLICRVKPSLQINDELYLI